MSGGGGRHGLLPARRAGQGSGGRRGEGREGGGAEGGGQADAETDTARGQQSGWLSRLAIPLSKARAMSPAGKGSDGAERDQSRHPIWGWGGDADSAGLPSGNVPPGHAHSWAGVSAGNTHRRRRHRSSFRPAGTSANLIA